MLSFTSKSLQGSRLEQKHSANTRIPLSESDKESAVTFAKTVINPDFKDMDENTRTQLGNC